MAPCPHRRRAPHRPRRPVPDRRRPAATMAHNRGMELRGAPRVDRTAVHSRRRMHAQDLNDQTCRPKAARCLACQRNAVTTPACRRADHIQWSHLAEQLARRGLVMPGSPRYLAGIRRGNRTIVLAGHMPADSLIETLLGQLPGVIECGHCPSGGGPRSRRAQSRRAGRRAPVVPVAAAGRWRRACGGSSASSDAAAERQQDTD